MNLIIIAGMPSAGKTTLARKLSAVFGYPILEKDEMKEMLFDHLGYADRIEKRKLDYASNAILLQTTEKLLQKDVSLIIVNNFRSDAADPKQQGRQTGGGNQYRRKPYEQEICTYIPVHKNHPFGTPTIPFESPVRRNA